MHQPVMIGLPEMDHTFFRAYMRSKYVTCLHHVGARVRPLHWTELEQDIQRYVSQCDGLLLPGGQDIAPSYYGQTPIEACGAPHPRRDQLEIALAQAFIRAGKPVLGICRGLQVLNVAMGGTLIQDITPLQSCQHSDFPHRTEGVHRVTIEKGTLLHRIFPTDLLKVDSMHHQVPDIAAPGLRICAKSEDGFIEGLEMPAARFCLGVQWHPEHMSKKHIQQLRLFRALALACRS